MAMLDKCLNRVFRFSSKDVDVRVGSVFRHSGPGDMIETAKVLEIEPDAMGIPHVRYELMIERNHRRLNDLDTRRTLNLQTFSSRFSELVQA